MEENDDEARRRREDSRSVDQMLMRLDEIGENYENLRTKVISHSST